MTPDTSTPPGAAVRPWRRYSDALGTVICARAQRGESLTAICADEGLPCRATVRVWAKTRPGFGARLLAAVKAGRGTQAGRRPVWCRHVAALICERIAMGMTTRQAVDLPGLPCETTVYGWLQTRPEFAEAYGRARLWQAHRRFDQVWEIAEAAEPGTAFVARVKIDAARWQAARLAPWRYGAKALGDGAAVDGGVGAGAGEGDGDVVQIRKFGAGPGEAQWVDVPWPRKRVGKG
jgi:hypothetical protein